MKEGFKRNRKRKDAHYLFSSHLFDVERRVGLCFGLACGGLRKRSLLQLRGVVIVLEKYVLRLISSKMIRVEGNAGFSVHLLNFANELLNELDGRIQTRIDDRRSVIELDSELK